MSDTELLIIIAFVLLVMAFVIPFLLRKPLGLIGWTIQNEEVRE